MQGLDEQCAVGRIWVGALIAGYGKSGYWLYGQLQWEEVTLLPPRFANSPNVGGEAWVDT